MKIDCIHGYFKFSEVQAGQLSDFVSRYGFELERSGDHFTFADLVDAPDYSLVGGLFLGSPTITAFEGQPWDVMRENRLVYHFALGRVVPLDLVVQVAEISQAGNYFLTTGMLLPGSLTDRGQRVTDYAAFYSRDRGQFLYSEIQYD